MCSVQTGAGSNSDSTLNTVDLVKMQCDCGLYDKGNVCTHIVSAYTEAQKFIDIAQLGADMARDIVAKKQYHVDDFITVHPTDVSATFVFTGDPVFCTCAVNSYGQKCVCLHVADCLQTTNNSHSTWPTTCPTAGSENLFVPTNVTAQVQLQSMLTDLLEWSKSENYMYSNDLYTTVKRAHTVAYNHFGIVSRKRKTHALHAYRQRIEQAKRELYKKQKTRRYKR